jgi:hypothetical protein
MTKYLAASLLTLLFAGCVFSQGEPGLLKMVRAPVNVPKFAASPVIDGKPDEEMWKQAAVLKDLIQTSPGDHIAASKRTEVYVAYDETHLYVAFKCWDDRDKIRATVVQRDEVFDGDNVQFWLDTYDDQRRAYNFAFNPLGIQQDGVQTEGQGTDYDVDLVFESKGVIEDWGWSIEVKLPFKSLRYSAGKGKFWGFNVARSIARSPGEFNSWVPLPRGVPGFLNKLGKITGLDDIKTERTLEVIPTLTFKETGSRRSLDKFSNPPIEPDFGFTAKYSISPNITLDMAYNPDFADTEADAPVVEANQRFPIFFSEKRPFFLEGVDIFKTPMQAVYTRRIENPDLAVKLTGKIGKTSFGVFAAQDDPLFNLHDKKAYAGVVRVKRDVGAESNIGFLATSYAYPEKHNQVAGFDGRWKIDKHSNFSGQVLGSTTRNYFYDPFTDKAAYRTGNGASFTYNYNYNTRHVFFGAGGGGTTRDFRSDLGFFRQTNTMSHFANIGYNTDPKPKAFLIRKSISGFVSYGNAVSGRFMDWGASVNGNLSFQGNAGIGGGLSLGKERIYEDEFGPARHKTNSGTFFGEPFRDAAPYSTFIFFYKEFNRHVSVDADLSLSYNSFDYDFGAGPEFPRVSPAALKFGEDAALDPGEARGQYFSVGVDLKPTNNFSLDFEYDRSSLKRNVTRLYAYKSNNFELGSTYQFSRFANIKARVYYDTLSHEIFGQYTFAWTPSVGKALYIGYNSNANYNGYAFDKRVSGFLLNNQTFFVKMTYLIRRSF